mmetsp:Transcript_28603/g.56205  ORF Transcript_28603/g.56205 Transcript_28603/m.56205 type:complete len:407 (-) Transcript_28603:291-1511(-)
MGVFFLCTLLASVASSEEYHPAHLLLKGETMLDVRSAAGSNPTPKVQTKIIEEEGLYEIDVPLIDMNRCRLPTAASDTTSLEMKIKFSHVVRTVVHFPVNASWADPITYFSEVTHNSTLHPAVALNSSLLDGANLTLPVVVFGYEEEDDFPYLARALAQKGFAVVSVLLSGATDAVDFAKDILTVAAEIVAEARAPDSPLYNKLSSDVTVMGYRSAGEAALMSVLHKSSLSAYKFPVPVNIMGYVAVAPRLLSEYVQGSLSLFTAGERVLVIGAGADCQYREGEHSAVVYSGIVTSACKTYALFNGATSCYFRTAAQDPWPVLPGRKSCLQQEQSCGGEQKLDSYTQRERFFNLVVRFLNFAHNTTAAAWDVYRQLLVAENAAVPFLQHCQVEGVLYSGLRGNSTS